MHFKRILGDSSPIFGFNKCLLLAIGKRLFFLILKFQILYFHKIAILCCSQNFFFFKQNSISFQLHLQTGILTASYRVIVSIECNLLSKLSQVAVIPTFFNSVRKIISHQVCVHCFLAVQCQIASY